METYRERDSKVAILQDVQVQLMRLKHTKQEALDLYKKVDDISFRTENLSYLYSMMESQSRTHESQGAAEGFTEALDWLKFGLELLVQSNESLTRYINRAIAELRQVEETLKH